MRPSKVCSLADTSIAFNEPNQLIRNFIIASPNENDKLSSVELIYVCRCAKSPEADIHRWTVSTLYSPCYRRCHCRRHLSHDTQIIYVFNVLTHEMQIVIVKSSSATACAAAASGRSSMRVFRSHTSTNTEYENNWIDECVCASYSCIEDFNFCF